ncbi:MAG: peptide chain release factor N(5)-glutamine methyltransferase [Proteobacteria bacterium]|nr:peptide chain release factor N(5)-glutamine methyltransferase [Pseudomonadota bacterium]
MQIVNALNYARQQLDATGSTRLDTEILLCSVLKCNRTNLYTYPEQELSSSDIESFNKLIALRSEGLPIAYLTEQKEFWSLSFYVNQDTLIPRPETELLVETSLKYIPTNSVKEILDLGTGTGAIAIAIASERPQANITATDINDGTLKIAKLNADSHQIKNIDFKKADWFDIANINSYDLIVSNPPYISTGDPHLKQGDVRFEPIAALTSGEDGLDDLRTIIQESSKHLNTHGWLLLEHGYNQGDVVRQLLIENGFTSPSTIKDYNGLERISFGQLAL